MNSDLIDVQSNRRTKTYAGSEVARRVLWGVVRLAFRFSPRPAFEWRSFLLRSLGATVGRHVHVYNTATIYYPWMLRVGDYASIGEHVYIYNLGLVDIGPRATISYRAHLCAGTHDFKDPNFPLIRPAVHIKEDAWICTDAFVGPGITVHRGAIVGARAVVTKDVAEMSIVGGNPARNIGTRPGRAAAADAGPG